MNRLFWILGLAVTAVLLLSRPCIAQKRLSEVLADETDLVLSVPNPVAVAGRIAETLELNDSSWDSVWKVLTDERFGVVDSSDFQAVQELCLDNTDLLAEIEELNVVCFSLDLNDICIVCSLDRSRHEELNRFFDSVRKLLEPENPDEKQGGSGAAIQLHELAVESCDDWVVASNSSERTAKVLAKVRKSIGENAENMRSSPNGISRVSEVFNQTDSRDSSVTIFGNPVAFALLFFANLSPEETAAYQFDRVQTIGLRVSVPDSSDLGNPLIKLDFVVPFAEPRTGFGKMVTCYKPLGEIPSIPFELTILDAMAFDPQDLFDANREIFDEANGQGSYLDSKQDLMDRYSLDYLQDDLPQTNEEIKFNYSLGTLHRIKMNRIADHAAATRYLDGVLEYTRELNLANGDGHLYKPRKSQFGVIYPSRGGIGKAKYSDAESELKAYANKNSTFFINQQWTITSSCTPAMVRLLDSLYSKDEPSESIRVLRAARAKLNGNGENVFRIQFFELGMSPLAYGEHNRVLEKFGNKSRKYTNYIRSSPNEDGYRMEIESQADSLAVASTLISAQLAKRLGTAIFFYSNGDDHLRVNGGLFPELKYAFDYNLVQPKKSDYN